jgi:hypothetical protein
LKSAIPQRYEKPCHLVSAVNEMGISTLIRHDHTKRGRPDIASVNIHVHDLAQIFNSLDPSPFWDRDLDRDAAAFIEDEFREKVTASVWHLQVHTHEGAASGADLQSAIKRYYERLATTARHQLHEQRRVGQWALAGGAGVFGICMSLHEALRSLLHGIPRVLDEGLIILAWIALWRPLEVLLYEWVPLYRRRRLYERLADVRVFVHVSAPPPVDASTSLHRP